MAELQPHSQHPLYPELPPPRPSHKVDLNAPRGDLAHVGRVEFDLGLSAQAVGDFERAGGGGDGAEEDGEFVADGDGGALRWRFVEVDELLHQAGEVEFQFDHQRLGALREFAGGGFAPLHRDGSAIDLDCVV